MFFTIIAVLTAVLIVSIFLPVKREVLIEGAFLREETEGWSSTLLGPHDTRALLFKQHCKKCLEKWRTTGERPMLLSLEYCSEGVPLRAKRLGIFYPQEGEAVKAIGWKTIWGRVLFYYYEPSNFVWISRYDEELRLEGLKRGFTDFEEYKKVHRQEVYNEWLGYMQKDHDLSREEAEILSGVYDLEEDGEAKRRGISVVDLGKIKDKEREEDFLDLLVCEKKLYGWKIYDLADKMIDGQTLPDELKKHFDECPHCSSSILHRFSEREMAGETLGDFEKMGIRSFCDIFDENRAKRLGITIEECRGRKRENYIIRYGGKNCFKLKERIAYAREMFLPEDRLRHVETCEFCKRMLSADREEFLSTGKLGGSKEKMQEEMRIKNI